MASHIEIIFPEPDPARREILILELVQLGFEGFEEKGDELKAYAPEASLNEATFSAFCEEHLTSVQLEAIKRTVLPEQNWNSTWESNFDPVVVGDFCAIRADFHEPISSTIHEIVITPKMSFGTGHHATTRLMIETMQQLPLADKQVVDFGTGTGVLAILAERLGAASVLALDNDSWSMENARENLERNGTKRIKLQMADNLNGLDSADIVLANINRHVLLSEMGGLGALIRTNGWLLLSGILEDDEAVMEAAAIAAGFTHVSTTKSGSWIAQLWQKR
jgi:ribosomal protein L11 methyltransferase